MVEGYSSVFKGSMISALKMQLYASSVFEPVGDMTKISVEVANRALALRDT